MELCTPRVISNLPHHHSHGSFNTNQLQWKPSLLSISLSKKGVHSYKYSSRRSTSSDDLSSKSTPYITNEPELISFEDKNPLKEEKTTDEHQKEPISVITMEDKTQSEEKEENSESVRNESFEDSTLDVQKKITEFLDQLNLKFDPEDSYSLVLFGSSALATLWFTSAVIGAIDSIPLFPKLMEVVGLGYTVWFSTRYLLFKRNREELVLRIEELKQKVIGSKDE